MARTDGGEGLVVLAGGRARRYGGCKPLAPVGPAGEAVIDLLVSDALAAGFTSVVLVVGPATGPAIRYHVERTWPRTIDLHVALQEEPLGTVHAVLCGVAHLPPDRRFGVANADDLYGRDALALLAGHLASDDPDETVVAFRLRNALVGDSPVTRGVCEVDGSGRLTAVTERRKVLDAGGGRFVARDGLEPVELSGDDLVSMNLWGFTPVMRAELGEAMLARRDVSVDAEVLLPDVVAEVLSRGRPAFRVMAATGRCIGVTHPDDLALVQDELARAVASGVRPAELWTGG